MSDNHGCLQVRKDSQCPCGEGSQQAAADHGSVQFTEADQPVKLGGFAVEAAKLQGFAAAGRHFLLQQGNDRTVGHSGENRRGNADNHPCHRRR